MRHDIKVVLTSAQELERLIRSQRADHGPIRRQRFTDLSGQRVYTQPLEAMPFEDTEWDDPVFDAVWSLCARRST